MSDLELARRKQLLLDKFLAGEIDKTAYDSLLAQLQELGSSVVEPAASGDASSGISSGSFEVTDSSTSAERSAFSAPVALLEAGMELGGFQLNRRLRRGGMGEVWQAYDPTGERTVVIKVLPPELQRSPDEMARVKQTFNRVHTLQHQHICPMYLLGQDPRFGYFIVMKYLKGDTLSAYRKAVRQKQDGFSLNEVIRVLAPIASALDYAHQRQIVHRDVKPQNIMLNEDGSDVQLVDFGLAAEIRTSVMRVSQVQMETCGTYPYMAPEQWRGEMQDARTDQYALAVVAFELLTGNLPFEAADPTVLRMCVLGDPVPPIPGASESVSAAMSRGMAKSREERFETCTAFVNALAVDLEPLELVVSDFVELDDAHDSTDSKGSTHSTGSVRSTDSHRRQPTVRAVDSERTMERVNARAMFWVTLIGSSVCLMMFGLLGWFVWAGVNAFFPPTNATTDSSLIAAISASGNTVAGGTDIPATPTPDPDPRPVAKPDPNVALPAAKPDDKIAQSLRYRWEHGRPYIYSVNVELEPDPDVIVSLSGNATYTRGAPVASKKSVPDDGKGTGTGFVVHSNGYLITCQHVIADAAEIEVAIGGKKFPATVMIEDIDHDLALIRIEANGLPTLKLGDSDKVELGEEVRAIGFPFSSILGDNIKATRGTVSGVNQEEGRKIFQVDAGINPGNSGGPLVNEKGEVIGVNFAKMREEMATNVGFAVPINDAIELLRSERVEFDPGNAKSARLTGPELVKLVSAATALITVKTGGGPAKGMHHFELRCQGTLHPAVRSKSGKFIENGTSLALQRQHLRSAMNRPASQQDVVETDPLGRVHEISGDKSPLPGFMGPLAIMVLEQLPSTQRQTWRNSFAISIEIRDENSNDFGPRRPFGPRFRPPGFPGFPNAPDNEAQRGTRIPGTVRVVYTLQESVGHLLKFKKDFELEAREQPGDKARIKLTGSGIVTFDSRAGVPRSLDYSGTLVENEHNKTTTLPIKLTYNLIDAAGGRAEIAQVPPGQIVVGRPVEADSELPVGTRLLAEWAGKWLPVEVLEVKPDGQVRIHWIGWGEQFDENLARVKLRFPAANPVEPATTQPPQVAVIAQEPSRRLSQEEIDQCLADLKTSNAGARALAATRLQRAVPLEERKDAVVKVLESMLKEKDPFSRKQAVDALGTWAGPETVPLLIQCLDESALLVKLAAIDALGKLKDERAAQPLAKLITEPGPRVQAAKALQSLGALAESAVLEMLMHPDPEVRQQACRLLKELGTSTSLPGLKTASEDADRTVATLAKEAATAIAGRQ